MRKQFSSLLMLGAVASGLFLTSCNKNNGAEAPDVQQNVVVSLDLGKAGLRAIGAATTKLENGAEAKIAAVDVYLTTADQTINVAKRFTNDKAGKAEYDKLVTSTAVGKTDLGGYKFLSVPNGTVKATVIVNPQGSLLTKGKLDKLEAAAVKVGVNEVLYAETQELRTVGSEKYGVDPQETSDVVKVAEFTLKGAMNRFQVVTKFSRIVYKDGTGESIKTWKTKWLSEEGNSDKTAADADIAFKKHIGAGYHDGVPTSEWGDFFKVEDITPLNNGVFMNNFNNKYNPITDEASEKLFAKTFVGTYDVTSGKWEPKGKGVEPNVSETASYFIDNKTNEDGFTTAPDGSVIAFNYFTKGVTNYGSKGDAPRLHFHFNGDNVGEHKGIDAEHQFVNIVGYEQDKTGHETLVADNVNGNHLLNINLQKLNNGDGIIVTAVDESGVTPFGKPDITNDAFNVIVRVQVMAWVETNVKPIVE